MVIASEYKTTPTLNVDGESLGADLRHYLDAASRMENVIGEGARECVNKMLIVNAASINYTLRAKI